MQTHCPCAKFAVSAQVKHVLLHAQPSSPLAARKKLEPQKVFYTRDICPKLQATISCTVSCEPVLLLALFAV
jgi:hypothetical protein